MWFDVSYVAPNFAHSPYKDQIAWIIRTVGIDKFLFGSDYPFFDQEEAMQSIDEYGFTNEEKRKLLHENAAGFLK